MDSNYPLVRMTNSISGNVVYARTYNWNSTSIQTGSRVITTEFVLPQKPARRHLCAGGRGQRQPIRTATFTYSPPPVPTGLIAASGSNALV